jgi:epoxyqueuosine reductase QueG
MLQDLVSHLDVDAVGIAALSDLKGTKLEEDALRLLPEARSIMVMAMEIYPEILAHVRPGRTMGQASLNDLLARNSDFLYARLTKVAYDVAKASHSSGLKALPLPANGCPVDARFMEAVFSYKHAGQAAGLGYIGRSSLLITPDFGPRVRLSCCLTEAVLEPRVTVADDVCEGCEICIDSCPAMALNRPQTEEPYVINKFACASFCGASGGCSECMRLCPASGG